MVPCESQRTICGPLLPHGSQDWTPVPRLNGKCLSAFTHWTISPTPFEVLPLWDWEPTKGNPDSPPKLLLLGNSKYLFTPERESTQRERKGFQPCPDWWTNQLIGITYRSVGDSQAAMLPRNSIPSPPCTSICHRIPKIYSLCHRITWARKAAAGWGVGAGGRAVESQVRVLERNWTS